MAGIEFMSATSSYNKAGKINQKENPLSNSNYTQGVNNFKQQLSNMQSAAQSLNAAGSLNNDNMRIAKNYKKTSILSSLLADNVSKISNAESIHLNALEGKASVADVVAAASEAELALKEIITLRDKLVEAFNKITDSAI
jgi:flagellar hook-basal body complex protein FliE